MDLPLLDAISTASIKMLCSYRGQLPHWGAPRSGPFRGSLPAWLPSVSILGFLLSNGEWVRATRTGLHLLAALHFVLPVEALRPSITRWAKWQDYAGLLPRYAHCAPVEAPAEVRGYYRYAKMAIVVGFVEATTATISASGRAGGDGVLRALEAFAKLERTWLKVAGGAKAEVL